MPLTPFALLCDIPYLYNMPNTQLLALPSLELELPDADNTQLLCHLWFACVPKRSNSFLFKIISIYYQRQARIFGPTSPRNHPSPSRKITSHPESTPFCLIFRNPRPTNHQNHGFNLTRLYLSDSSCPSSIPRFNREPFHP